MDKGIPLNQKKGGGWGMGLVTPLNRVTVSLTSLEQAFLYLWFFYIKARLFHVTDKRYKWAHVD